MNDIKTGEFRRVYLLYGKETYLKLQWRDRLVHALIPDAASMNLTAFAGAATQEGVVIDQAETLPFFADRRVIRLDNTGFFTRTTELLPDYLKSLPDYLCLVFTEDEVDKRNRLFKAVQKYGHCAEFAEQTQATLEKWILQMLGKADLRIRRSDMEFLLSRTGTDMSHIALEVDKLVNFCAGNGEVTRENIEFVTSDRTENRIFDMVAAITEHRQTEAMNLYADLLALKEPPMRILYLIGLQFNRLLMIRELDGEGLSANQIAETAGMPPFAVKKNLKLARSYAIPKLKEAVEGCTALEEDVKTGRISDRLSVELAILQLSHRAQPSYDFADPPEAY